MENESLESILWGTRKLHLSVKLRNRLVVLKSLLQIGRFNNVIEPRKRPVCA